MEHLKYPIGKFEYGKSYTMQDNLKHIEEIERFPEELLSLVSKMDASLIEKSYRPGGWTGRQIINHLADSHLNAYVRTKLTLTEDTPTIKPYNQDAWANMEDGKDGSFVNSLKVIDAIHARWVYLLVTLKDRDFQRKYIHPEYKREFQLDELLALYAWHCKQHYAHLKIILDNK